MSAELYARKHRHGCCWMLNARFASKTFAGSPAAVNNIHANLAFQQNITSPVCIDSAAGISPSAPVTWPLDILCIPQVEKNWEKPLSNQLFAPTRHQS